MALEQCAEIGDFYDSSTDETGVKVDTQRVHVTGKITTDTPLLTEAQDLAAAVNELFTLDPGGGDVWQPPADWIPVPEPSANEAYFLYDTSTWEHLILNGGGSIIPTSYTVNWGDGTVETFPRGETFGNSRAYHKFEKGKQYLIKVTITDSDYFSFFQSNTIDMVYEDYPTCGYVGGTTASIPISGYGLLIVKYGKNFPLGDGNTTLKLDGRYSLQMIQFPCFSTEYNISIHGLYCVKKVVLPPETKKISGDYGQFLSYSYSLSEKNINLNYIEELGSITATYAFIFEDCYGFQDLILPKCTVIGNGVFRNCKGLRSVYAPNCTYVGNSFYNCDILQKVTFADGCTFGANAFYGCYMLNPKPNQT